MTQPATLSYGVQNILDVLHKDPSMKAQQSAVHPAPQQLLIPVIKISQLTLVMPGDLDHWTTRDTLECIQVGPDPAKTESLGSLQAGRTELTVSKH